MVVRPKLIYQITILGVSLILALLCEPARAGQDSWDVVFEKTDLTSAASPIPASDGVLLNVSNIAPAVGISVFNEGSFFTIHSADGSRWTWEQGSGFIVSEAQQLPLLVPAINQGHSLFIDPETIALLSGLSVNVDTSQKLISFSRPGSIEYKSSAENGIGDGWQAFTISKPKAIENGKSITNTANSIRLNPPPGRDRLNLTLGLGYVQSYDFGMEAVANGRIMGGNLDLRAFLTQGDRGTQMRNFHLNWMDRESGKGIEAGDLYSETWGLIQGLRYNWKTNDDRWPSLTLYLNTKKTDNPDTAISYRDDIAITPDFHLQGEVSTDRSRYGTIIYEKGGLGLFAFRRDLPDNRGMSEGIFSSIPVTSKISLYYGISSSVYSDRQMNRSQTIGLRIPILSRYNLILDQTRRKNELGLYKSSSVGITIPLANTLNLFVRYQHSESNLDVFSSRFINIQNSSNSLVSSLSLFAGPKVHLDYQISKYSQGNYTSYREQLVTNYRISPTTNIQAITGFPNIADSDLLRLRLTRQIKDSMSLVVDYGRLSPYQSTDQVRGKRGFMIMLRKTWPLWVPMRGGTVKGVVTDQLGQPIPNLTIDLGQYSTLSDMKGCYQFKGVPTGDYQLRLSERSIPADYKTETMPYQISVDRDSEQTLDFMLVPLGSITGHVFMDKNGNGEYDPKEGLANISVFASDFATTSDINGRFGFYNLEPGEYNVRVAEEFLDKKYGLSDSCSLNVVLQPQASVTNLKFGLQERKKPIIFTTMD